MLQYLNLRLILHRMGNKERKRNTFINKAILIKISYSSLNSVIKEKQRWTFYYPKFLNLLLLIFVF